MATTDERVIFDRNGVRVVEYEHGVTLVWSEDDCVCREPLPLAWRESVLARAERLAGPDPRVFLGDVYAELLRARRKFPSSDGVLCALTEEVGELAKALTDESSERIYAEAVQVAAMALRVALEGDKTLEAIRLGRGQPPHPGAGHG